MAQWCTRVLWAVRDRYIKKDPELGAIKADRVVFSAVSMLKQDASMKNLRDALYESDQSLHCGQNVRAIQNSFLARGFVEEAAPMTKTFEIQVRPFLVGTSSSNAEVGFDLQLRNRDVVVARNVRVTLESLDSRVVPSTYMQGLGDIGPGKTIMVGSGALSRDYAVYGSLAQSITSGSRVKYRIRVRAENGPDTVFQGEFTR